MENKDFFSYILSYSEPNDKNGTIGLKDLSDREMDNLRDVAGKLMFFTYRMEIGD